jgi:hypothetical protein
VVAGLRFAEAKVQERAPAKLASLGINHETVEKMNRGRKLFRLGQLANDIWYVLYRNCKEGPRLG